MGQYMNPSAIEGQQRIYPRYASDTATNCHRDLLDQARGGILIAHCDRGIFKFAVKVNDLEEFEEFYRQYQGGMLLSFDVYVVSTEHFEANKQ